MTLATTFWNGFWIGLEAGIFAILAVIIIAFLMSPEEREHRAIKQRLHDDGMRARGEIYDRRYNEVREQLRRERGT